MGATVSSETTAAATGAVGKLRHDPFAMLPFCGYNMGDYFAHWLKIGSSTQSDKLPKIFYVIGSEKAQGEWLWPGFGENSRVLKWIFERTSGVENAVDTPIGKVPAPGALDLKGIKIPGQNLDQLFFIDKESWIKEVQGTNEYFKMFGDKLPTTLTKEITELEHRLNP